jgi:hypothetical protein
MVQTCINLKNSDYEYYAKIFIKTDSTNNS